MASTSRMSVAVQDANAQKKPKLTEIIPPLDFSFLHLGSLEECEKEEPRDLSPHKALVKKKSTTQTKEKSQSLGLKLNNNTLKEISNLVPLATSLFDNVANISWIDLSCNFLSIIDPVLTQFENLKILYLHGNSIAEMKEVNKLSSLQKLWKLTLHGNEIENIKGYRFFVLAALPNLVSFDFSTVTKGDRVTAATFKSFYGSDKKKQIKRES
ncbi:leucine-rich repeat-containing protein 51-like [Physella acuta]|uniref:leucine-rich repeat-containing protein 51-like n=1 Tax=Physella acuta TaxID=109671 RepID=UPI0027DDF151|nr:leucine-rich repeat-containing protein 51-like [Physella acuta]